jgi:hypothetical protein
MTDDITRGLALLADEAEPAPVNPDEVITRARARTRNRAIVTTALVTLAVVGALVVSLGNIRQGPEPVAVPPSAPVGPAPGTYVPEQPDPKDDPARKEQMNVEITDAMDRILPDGWTVSGFTIECNPGWGCQAHGTMTDSLGTVQIDIRVGEGYSYEYCYRPTCTRTIAGDGTLVQLRNYENNDGIDNVRKHHTDINAVRPGGISISIAFRYPVSREEPPLTDEQWVAFGTAFTYSTN